MPQVAELGVRLAAVSLDSPEALGRLREDCGLGFELLSDARRETVRAWDLLNARERDGIAFPCCAR
jgi:peroxiredoxin